MKSNNSNKIAIYFHFPSSYELYTFKVHYINVKNLPAIWETWVWSLGWEDPLEEDMATHLSVLALENPPGQRCLAGYSPGGHKESDTTELQSTAAMYI